MLPKSAQAMLKIALCTYDERNRNDKEHIMENRYSRDNLSRRGFIGSSLALTLAPLGLQTLGQQAAAQQHPPDGAEQLTHYQEAEQGGEVHGPHIWLRWNNAPLVSYRAHHGSKYPYFYPLMGLLSGQSLTSETAEPWPHHRSMYLGCDKVNGFNFWQQGLERGQILSQGPKVTEATKTSAVIEDACEWRPPNEPLQMSDTRKYTVTVDYPNKWILDAEIEWKAEVDVAIEKTNHALFSVRSAIDIAPWGGGNLVTSEGNVGESNTFGKPARWCAFYGKRAKAKGEPVEGIALIDHPDNPWEPCPWFTRDYGMMSPMPFQWIEEPWRLPAGESVHLKYRTVMFSGTPEEAGLDAISESWINS